jgi:hypothetical protein
MTRYASPTLPLLALPALALLASCASTPQQRERAASDRSRDAELLAAEFRGLVPGKPETCLPLPARTQYQTRGYGDTLVYEVSSKLKYRNDTNGGCGGVGRNDDILVTQSFSGRLCRGDIARTVQRATGINTGGCSFGDFVPYRKPS